jgi:hypothetical protein
MLANYLRLIVFAFGLLAGIQVPGFVDQYAKRVSAHQLEAVRALKGFQDTANQYFAGSVKDLIAHHLASSDPAFKDEAKTIQALSDRLASLSAELAAMQGPLIQQILHVALRADREILTETWVAYSYTVPLRPSAIISGVASGAVAAALIEGLFSGLGRLMRPTRLPANVARLSRRSSGG